MNWKDILIVFLIWAVVIIAAFFALRKVVSPTFGESAIESRTIQISGEDVKVSVANTLEARKMGLSGRNELGKHDGMLFVFDTAARYGFWMKDMRFPIDILWLSDDGKVLEMRENVRPATYPEVFTSNVPARYVLELPAWFVRDNNVAIGDIVKL